MAVPGEVFDQHAHRFLIPEPTLTHTFLPRCPNCHQRHPLAFQPPLPADVCPTCSAPIAPLADPVEVPALLSGGRAWFGWLMIRIGQWLNRLAQRIDPCP